MILLSFSQSYISDIICVHVIISLFLLNKENQFVSTGSKAGTSRKMSAKSCNKYRFSAPRGDPQNFCQKPALYLAEIWQKWLESKVFQQNTSNFISDLGGAYHRLISHAIIPCHLVKLGYSIEWNKYLFTLIFFFCILIFADLDSLRLYRRNHLKKNAHITHIRKSIIAAKQTSKSQVMTTIRLPSALFILPHVEGHCTTVFKLHLFTEFTNIFYSF